MNWAQYLITASVIATLIYASYRDIKYRDIPELTWVPASALSIALNLMLGNYDLLHTLFSLMPAILVLIMSLLDLVGGADFLALLLVSLAYPRFAIMPISFLTLAYSLIMPLLLMIYYVLLNIVKYRHYLNNVKCLKGKKWYLIVFGRPLRVRDFLKGNFIYPLTIPLRVKDGYVCRATFNDDEEEMNIRKEIADAVSRGELNGNELLWVTPGLPHVLFFLVGFLLALITPQKLIILLLTAGH